MKKYISLFLIVTIILSIYPGENAMAKDDCDWKNLYSEYLESEYSDAENYKAALIYIDGDNIPELYIY